MSSALNFGDGRLPFPRRFAVAVIVLHATLIAGLSSSAAPIRKSQNAEHGRVAELVSEALHQEVYGQNEQRTALLENALAQAPNFAPARWHSGQIEVNERWLAVDDVPNLFAQDQRRKAYFLERVRRGDEMADHHQLALWCEDKGLHELAHAHWRHILLVSSDHAEARRRLSFQQVEGIWLSEESLAAQRERNRQMAAALKAWQKPLAEVLRGIESDSLRVQRSKVQELREIAAEDAVFALEVFAAYHSATAADAVVDCLHEIDTSESAASLARLSVLSPWEHIRRKATARLLNRQWECFIPELLQSLHEPLVIDAQVQRGVGGRMVYRQVLARENREYFEIVVLDLAYKRLATPSGDGAETLSVALASMGAVARERTAVAAELNLRIAQQNIYIFNVLETVTGERFKSARQWWRWWDEHQGVLQIPKQVRKIYHAEQITLADRPTIDQQTSADDGLGEEIPNTLRSSQREASPSHRPSVQGPSTTPAPRKPSGDPRLQRSRQTTRSAWRPGIDPRTYRPYVGQDPRLRTRGSTSRTYVSVPRRVVPQGISNLNWCSLPQINIMPTSNRESQEKPSLLSRGNTVNPRSGDLQAGIALAKRAAIAPVLIPEQPPLPPVGFDPLTIVWTDQGQRTIGTLEVGDRVLAKHPETGELAYKPVVANVRQKITALNSLTTVNDSIGCCPTQAFWVCGEGWRRADQLRSADQLHGATGSARIHPSQAVDAYGVCGIIVADFHTLLVGHDKLIAHDNTHRRPTKAIVPGLPAVE